MAFGVLTPSCVLVSAPTAKVTAVRLRSRTCARPSIGLIAEALANLAEAVEWYLEEVDDPAGHLTATPLVTTFRLPAA